jgi:hypothetical protein
MSRDGRVKGNVVEIVTSYDLQYTTVHYSAARHIYIYLLIALSTYIL